MRLKDPLVIVKSKLNNYMNWQFMRLIVALVCRLGSCVENWHTFPDVAGMNMSWRVDSFPLTLLKCNMSNEECMYRNVTRSNSPYGTLQNNAVPFLCEQYLCRFPTENPNVFSWFMVICFWQIIIFLYPPFKHKH